MIDKNKVKDLVEQWLEGKEYFLVDASVDEQNKITVEIDHKDGVWIEDCCELSKFIEEHFDRDVEDFELEVGSAGIGQPFKVLQQYINSIGYDVELLTAEGKKMEGYLKSADENGFVVTVEENVLAGGFGEGVLDVLATGNIGIPVLTLGLPNRFIAQATVAEQTAECALDALSIAQRIHRRLSEIEEAQR
jgi:ribosome maturation factor RimP